MTMDEIKSFQSTAKLAIYIYECQIAAYTSVLDELQEIINQFDKGGDI